MSARGLTQEALADEIDRGQSWVNHKLSGRRKTNVEDIVLIAKALNVAPSLLLENLSNPEQLHKNFFASGSAEPGVEYTFKSFSTLEHKLDKLEPETRDNFFDQVESMLDILIDTNTSEQ